MWPVVERAIDFVLDLQTPRGEILWARHADGTPWSFALLTGSSSICHSLRCAIALAEQLGHERPDWELSAGPARPRHPPRARRLRAQAPLGDGLVLPGARRRASAATTAASAWPSGCDTFVMDGNGVRCVTDRPWITAAETCECAHGPPGRRRRRRRPLDAVRAGPSAARTTTAATGPASSTPTRSTSPAASGRPTPRPPWSWPPTPWRSGRPPAGCSPATTSCCPSCIEAEDADSSVTDRD